MSEVFISLGIVLPEARNGIWRALVFLRRYRVPRFSSILSERCRVFACCVPPEALATGYVPHASREENRTPGPKKGVSAHGLYEVSLNRRGIITMSSVCSCIFCAQRKKRRPTDRRTEIIQLRIIDFARALGFRSILGGGAVPRHQALVSCP
jgi:hypothetical protein